jgi:hypothetical protein
MKDCSTPADTQSSPIGDVARRRRVCCRSRFGESVAERPASTIHAESEQLVPSIIVVASTEPEGQIASQDDPRRFQLKERVTASDVANAHFSSQLIERIGWALADAERAEREEPGQLEE